MNRKGVTLIEMLLASAIGAAVLLGAATYMTKSARFTEGASRKSADDTTLLQASQLITTTGRVAGGSGCTRPGPATLECLVDKTVPATGALRRMRFFLAANTLLYQEHDGTNWNTVQSYPNVSGFEICTPAEIVNDTCALEPRAINRAFASVAPASIPYFRFRLTRAGANPNEGTTEIQSGFFPRNSSQLAPGLALQFGGTIR